MMKLQSPQRNLNDSWTGYNKRRLLEYLAV